MATKLREAKILRPLFALRDFIWKKTGLFNLKKKIKRKRYFSRAAKEDNKRRKAIADQIMQLPNDLLSLKEGINIVVSMTSYGYRVEKTCPYALYSILKQSYIPNRIILNIDKKQWNDNNIPMLLKKLQDVGVEINYTDDIGPHTKLIPTLAKYPDDIVITADDDVYYDAQMIEELYGSYKKSNKRSVICREGLLLLKKDGKFMKYSECAHIKESQEDDYIMPFGVGGVLYPPHVFGDEIFNLYAIKELAPKADDIWFSAMEIYYGIDVKYVTDNSWRGDSDVDRNEEYNEAVSGALYMTNDLKGMNDVQWDAVVNHYKLNSRDK